MRKGICRENLITCGLTNELAHAVWTEYSCDSFMADKMGLDGTMPHYLAVLSMFGVGRGSVGGLTQNLGPRGRNFAPD